MSPHVIIKKEDILIRLKLVTRKSRKNYSHRT